MKNFAKIFWLLSSLLGMGRLVAEATVVPLATLQTLANPAGDDAGESSLVRGPDGSVYLTWAEPGAKEGERALRVARLAPGATTWGEARTITSTPRLMENWADFATLVVESDGAWVAQWYERPADPEQRGYDGWYARSVDEGNTWTPPVPLGHEFVSMVPWADGQTLAVWLESARIRDTTTKKVKRDPAAPRPTRDPQAPYEPSMRLKGRLLSAEGATQAEWVIDPDVCTCCQTSLAVLPDGRAMVTYRGRMPGEIRDSYVSVFSGQDWSQPKRISEDGWMIPGCPVNGPAVDAEGPKVALTWFTMAAGVARVQAKLSGDAGATWGPACPIDLGKPLGRLDLVSLPDGSAVISWLEMAAGVNEAGLYVRRVAPDGRVSAPKQIVRTSSVRASGFPRMALQGSDRTSVVVSWTDLVEADGAVTVTRVRTALFSAEELEPLGRGVEKIPSTTTTVAVVRGGEIAFLDWCAEPEAVH